MVYVIHTYTHRRSEECMGIQGMGVQGMGIQGMGVQGMGIQGMGVQGMGIQGMGVQGMGIQGMGNVQWWGPWQRSLQSRWRPLSRSYHPGPVCFLSTSDPSASGPHSPAQGRYSHQ